jgi:hypothetical protein
MREPDANAVLTRVDAVLKEALVATKVVRAERLRSHSIMVSILLPAGWNPCDKKVLYSVEMGRLCIKETLP